MTDRSPASWPPNDGLIASKAGHCSGSHSRGGVSCKLLARGFY